MKWSDLNADAQELQPDASETVGSGNVKKILLDPDDAAKRDAEKYRLLQAAAQVELCRRAIGREPDVSDWERWVKSGDPPIDPLLCFRTNKSSRFSAQHKALAMLHLSRRAAAINECLDAVRLAQDSARLHAAPAAKLVSAATACAKTLERVAERTGHLGEHRASAFHVIDRARHLLERELRRRGPNIDH